MRNKFLFTIFLVLLYFTLFSQSISNNEKYKFKTHTYFGQDFGFSYLFGKSIYGENILGWNTNFRFRFDLPKRKYSIIPFFGVNIHKDNYQNNSCLDYNSLIIKTGLQLNRRLIKPEKTGKFYIGNLFRINYTWIDIEMLVNTNYFTWNIFKENYLLYEILMDKSVSIGTGFVFQFKQFIYCDISYNLLVFNADYNEEDINRLKLNRIDLNVPDKINFSHLNVNVGLTLPIKYFVIFFPMYFF